MFPLSKSTRTSFGGFVDLSNIDKQQTNMLVAILIRLSKRYENIFTNTDILVFCEMYSSINRNLELDYSNLVGYVKGLFLKNTIHTYLKIENEYHYDTFRKILTKTDMSEDTDELRTMLFAKLDYTKHDIQSAITWFEKASLDVKKIMIMSFYIEISHNTIQNNPTDETESETETETEEETETEAETEEREEAFQYEPVTCGDCGNQWDGYAQCNCWEDYNYSQTDSTPNDSTICMEELKEEPQEPVPTSHPMCWSSTNHYGMCGQSCPCCRAEVGDTLGACPICLKK
tara:strand:+ start:71 stop:934 length:864 start_codon:yes stop_codon:yes gene_type:complete